MKLLKPAIALACATKLQPFVPFNLENRRRSPSRQPSTHRQKATSRIGARRVSSLLSRSFTSASSFSKGRSSSVSRGISKYSTTAAVEDPITPPVTVNHTKLLINGQFVDAASGKTFPTLDPRTGDVIARVAEGDAEDVNRAVAAARKAFDEGPWPKMTAYVAFEIVETEIWWKTVHGNVGSSVSSIVSKS